MQKCEYFLPDCFSTAQHQPSRNHAVGGEGFSREERKGSEVEEGFKAAIKIKPRGWRKKHHIDKAKSWGHRFHRFKKQTEAAPPVFSPSRSPRSSPLVPQVFICEMGAIWGQLNFEPKFAMSSLKVNFYGSLNAEAQPDVLLPVFSFGRFAHRSAKCSDQWIVTARGPGTLSRCALAPPGGIKSG